MNSLPGLPARTDSERPGVQVGRAAGARAGAPPVRFPLPRLGSGAGPSVVFACSKIDNRGRLSDRSAVRELRWWPGMSVTFTVVDDGLIIVSPGLGRCGLTTEGHLRLPAAIRHRCRVVPGDRLLVVVASDRAHLVIWTAAALAGALSGAGVEGRA